MRDTGSSFGLYEDEGGTVVAGNHSIQNGADGIHVSQDLRDR